MDVLSLVEGQPVLLIMPICHLLLCLRMPFEITAMLFLLALFAGKLAASLSKALLYLSGSITTPGVFRIFGRVRFLRHAGNQSAVSRDQSCASFGHTLHTWTETGFPTLVILGLSR